MTKEEEKTFRKVFALLDSDVEGEREAALHQVRGLLAKQKPPRKFRDLLAALEKNVPLETYREREAELQKYAAANQELERQNAAYAKAAAPQPRRSSWLVIWAARVEAAAIAATVAAVIAAGAHHQAMKDRQFWAGMNLAAVTPAVAGTLNKSKDCLLAAHRKKWRGLQ